LDGAAGPVAIVKVLKQEDKQMFRKYLWKVEVDKRLETGYGKRKWTNVSKIALESR
jgi:hypothetical protein